MSDESWWSLHGADKDSNICSTVRVQTVIHIRDEPFFWYCVCFWLLLLRNWEGKHKELHLQRCANCSHKHDAYKESEWSTTHINVDILHRLQWPHGTINASPTQIKSTQLEALLKAKLVEQRNWNKPTQITTWQCQFCLDTSTLNAHVSLERDWTEITWSRWWFTYSELMSTIRF